MKTDGLAVLCVIAVFDVDGVSMWQKYNIVCYIPPTSDMAGKEKALVQELGEKLFGRLTAADIDV